MWAFYWDDSTISYYWKTILELMPSIFLLDLFDKVELDFYPPLFIYSSILINSFCTAYPKSKPYLLSSEL